MAFRFSCQTRNRSFPRPTQQPRLETLETRENPAIIQWTNPFGGDWNNPANWDLGRLPAAQDDVIIDVPGAVTITHSSGNTTVQSIQSQEALVLNGGVLDVNGPMHVAGGISFSSATLRDAIVSASTTINASIATLDGVTLNGVLNLPNYLQVVNGLTVNGTINASGFAAHLRFQGSQTLGGTGTAIFGNGYGLLSMGASDVLTIGAGFTARGFNFGVGTLAEAGAQGTFVNYGTLISDGGANGVLGLNGNDWVNHGTVTIHPGKILGTNYYTPNRPWTNHGSITINGGTALFYASQWTNLGTLEVRGGTALTDYSQTTNFSGNTLTGGTWKVGPNTSLRLNIGDIATLNGNIILEGTNSNLLKAATNTSALTPLATIGTSGGLTLAGGRELTLNQNLTTSGNLVVERTSRLTIPGTGAAITQLAGTSRIDGTLTLGQSVQQTTVGNPITYLSADGNALDSVGGRNGTLVNGTSYTQGIRGDAFRFDGVDDYVNLGSHAAFDVNDFSISAWVFIDPARNTGLQRAISRDDYLTAGGDGREFFSIFTSYNDGLFNFTGKALFGILRGGQGSFVVAPTTLAAGWRHLTGVRQGGTLKLFVDGVEVASGPGVVGPINPEAPLVLGRLNPNYSQELFHGALDEFHFFDRALTTQEVTTLYNSVGPLPQPVPYSGNFQVQGGVVQGSGLIQANVTNQGTLKPGSPLGALTIAGNLTQNAVGTTEIQLGGTNPGTDWIPGSRIEPLTYETLNGETGAYQYWDDTYFPNPPTANMQPLSGGKGQLSDGIVATTNWNANPYPYVAWAWAFNPTVNFQFDKSYNFNKVRIHVDDSNGYGAVFPPSMIKVTSNNQQTLSQTIFDPPSGSPFWIELDITGFQGDEVSVQIFQTTGNWVFVSEIEFLGEPTNGYFDQLSVVGSATLDGTLAVGTLNGFVPAPTDSFRVLTFASKTGDFATYAPITPGLAIPTRTFDPSGLTLGAVLAGNADPIANAGPDLAANEGDTVSFDASASYDPNQDSLSYLWDFGDGNTATGLNPTHTYADNGTYTVTLTVTDPHGASDTDTLTVTVANVAPTVTLNAPSAATVGKAFSIQVSATDPSTSDTLAGFTYSIDWGDGSTRSGGRLSKKYSTPGQYTISVIATDKDGASSIVQTQTVTVSGAVFQIGSVGVGLFDRSETTAASGSSNDDTIQGALNASNWIDGGWGADTITGGNQADLLFSDRGTQGNAALSNDADADELVGVRTQSSGVTTGEVETLIGMGGDDLLFGAGATDILYGDSTNPDDPLVSGNDLLVGYGGDDQLFGGYGDDTLVGGIGNDLLDGGQGLDEASWRDLSFEGTGDHVAGVVLNLSSTTIQYQSGLRKGDSAIWIDGVRIAEADQAPVGSIGWGGNIVRDVAAMTAKHKSVNNWLNSTDTILSIEVFEGSRQANDVAVLSSGFQALGQPDDDGYQAYTNGTITYWFKDFETVVILPAPF